MAIETGLIGRAFGALWSLVDSIRRRRNARSWAGHWEAYNLVGRDLTEPKQGAGFTHFILPSWWTFSSTLTFECCECDARGQPTRQQKGNIDPNDPRAATRVGRYLDSAEVYEQRLTMLDQDTILILPVPDRSTLGNVYGRHGWRRKRKQA